MLSGAWSSCSLIYIAAAFQCVCIYPGSPVVLFTGGGEQDKESRFGHVDFETSVTILRETPGRRWILRSIIQERELSQRYQHVDGMEIVTSPAVPRVSIEILT